MLALVTGGNRGIGRAIAKKLAENGFDIIICGRNKDTIAQVVAEIKSTGRNAFGFRCDMTKPSQIKALVKRAAKIGVPDVLVNDAGVAFRKNLLDNEQEEIDAMIDVNLRGLICCTKEFLPKMLERGRGIIVNISSGAGKAGFPELAVYCATKFGVIGFTESLAREVEKEGVRVYAICPGDTETDMWRSLYPGERATYLPEDVAIEVMELLKNADRIAPGSAIDVKKHV
jgi:3-oxoacyl-[acyl-carrier protein] reductase